MPKSTISEDFLACLEEMLTSKKADNVSADVTIEEAGSRWTLVDVYARLYLTVPFFSTGEWTNWTLFLDSWKSREEFSSSLLRGIPDIVKRGQILFIALSPQLLQPIWLEEN